VAKIVKIPGPGGTPVEGEEIDFTPVQEPFSTYKLEDGYSIRFKAVVTQIIRTTQKDADGNPAYFVRSSNVISVSPPETYKKREVN
jgi:hypothetical protein